METAKHIKKNCSVSLVKSMCNNEIGFQKNIVNYLNQKENTLDSFQYVKKTLTYCLQQCKVKF